MQSLEKKAKKTKKIFLRETKTMFIIKYIRLKISQLWSF